MQTHIENIIIGAGPSGLQLAYYFNKYNINYIIFEKETNSGSFFSKYPHTKQLISINKKFTGKNKNDDFNLRHDWNSLLNDDGFLFNQFSDKLYPHSEDLHKYLNEFSNKYELNIKYNSNILEIHKNTDLTNNYNYTIKLLNNDTYTCDKLIVATGMSLPIYPDINVNNTPYSKTNNALSKINHYCDYPNNYFINNETLKTYENKKVLIIGAGNSAFELANTLQNYCSNVIIYGKIKPFSFITHYAGDIRSVYLPFLDTFYLKSLNGIDNFQNESIDKNNSSITYNKTTKQIIVKSKNNMPIYQSTPELHQFDEVIFCIGWKFNNSLFKFDIDLCLNNKFPLTKYNYESSNNNNLFFIGSLMHSKDYLKSSGGFIHGFRYLIKLFTQINYNIDYCIKEFNFNGNMLCYNELANYIEYRINNASSIYQMFGILGDVFYYDKTQKKIIYIQDQTIQNIMVMPQLINIDCFNVINLEYGDNLTNIKEIGGFNKYNPSLLHLKIYIYEKRNGVPILQDRITFEEDLIAQFNNYNIKNKIKQTLKMCNLII